MKVIQYAYKNKYLKENIKYYSAYCGWLAEQMGADIYFFDKLYFNKCVFCPYHGQTI